MFKLDSTICFDCFFIVRIPRTLLVGGFNHLENYKRQWEG